MWRQWLRPDSRLRGSFRIDYAGIDQNIAFWIASDKIAPTYDVIDARPAMCVQRRGVTGRNSRLEHADRRVFQQQRVMPRRRNYRVQRVRPGIVAHTS